MKAITEALCGHAFSASTKRRINELLDGTLKKFAQRRLEGSRQGRGVDGSSRESAPSCKAFIKGLTALGLTGVAFVVSDDHVGLKGALPEAVR